MTTHTQKENSGVLDDRTRNGDSLFLTARKLPATAATNIGVYCVVFRERFNELVDQISIEFGLKS